MAKRHRHSPPLSSPISENTIFSPHPPSDSDSDFSLASAATSKKYNRIDPHLLPSTQINPPAVIHCNFLPACNQRPFSSYAEFESHYNQQHSNRCHECHKNFPSERYLSIHISENHDVFVELKREKGEKTFACFVEGCERLCSTPQKRRLHVIDKHGFPKDFYFRVVDNGIDNCNSLLRPPRRNSKSTLSGPRSSDTSMPSSPERTRNNKPERRGVSNVIETKEVEMGDHDENTPAIEEEKSVPFVKIPTVAQKDRRVKQPRNSNNSAFDQDKEMKEVTDLVASMKFVPRSVKFGRRGGGMVGFASH